MESRKTNVEAARTALLDSPISELRELEVEQDGDLLLISGRVGTWYHKQLAQEAVRAVADEMQVVNGVAVE